ncbi:Conserved_hypothetical protein [Hexamita inflata]|uniref:Uncharacterized protein n=1 Tax=Hexamita inflata TaxID=28002 RepID=A0AA86PB44_9EUKA|nr:Conserved hypothetical protein [Hexamita inflata]
MTEQYKQYASHHAEADLLIIKEVLDNVHQYVPTGTQPTLSDILTTFEFLQNSKFFLPLFQNSLIYAALLKMSQISRFTVPKVMSFVEVSTVGQTKKLTWYVRLELVYQFLYYNYLWKGFYEQKLLKISFQYFQIAYRSALEIKIVNQSQIRQQSQFLNQKPYNIDNISNNYHQNNEIQDNHDSEIVNDDPGIIDDLDYMLQQLQNISVKTTDKQESFTKDIQQPKPPSSAQNKKNTSGIQSQISKSKNKYYQVSDTESSDSQNLSDSLDDLNVKQLKQSSMLKGSSKLADSQEYKKNINPNLNSKSSENSSKSEFPQSLTKTQENIGLPPIANNQYPQQINSKLNKPNLSNSENQLQKKSDDSLTLSGQKLMEQALNKNTSMLDSNLPPPSGVQNVESVFGKQTNLPDPSTIVSQHPQNIIVDQELLQAIHLIDNSIKLQPEEQKQNSDNQTNVSDDKVAALLNPEGAVNKSTLDDREKQFDHYLHIRQFNEKLVQLRTNFDTKIQQEIFMTWIRATKSILQFKSVLLNKRAIKQCNNFLKLIVFKVKQIRQAKSIGLQLIHRKRKQLCLRVFDGFEEIIDQRKQSQSKIVKLQVPHEYIVNVIQLREQIEECEEELKVELKNNEVLKNKLVELESRMQQQQQTYKFNPVPKLQLLEYEKITSQFSSSQTRLDQLQDQLQQYRLQQLRLTSLSNEEAQRYKTYKLIISKFPSTQSMPEQLVSPQLHNVFQRLLDYVQDGITQVKNRRHSQIKIEEPNVDSRIIQKEQVDLDPQQLKLISFKLVQTFMHEMLAKGHEMIPASQNSLRRPIDYLNLLICAHKMENYQKMLFISILKFEKDLTNYKLDQFVTKRYFKYLRNSAHKRAELRKYQENVELFYDDQIVRRAFRSWLNETLAKQYISQFVQKVQFNATKKIFKLLKEALKIKRLENKQYLKEIQQYNENMSCHMCMHKLLQKRKLLIEQQSNSIEIKNRFLKLRTVQQISKQLKLKQIQQRIQLINLKDIAFPLFDKCLKIHSKNIGVELSARKLNRKYTRIAFNAWLTKARIHFNYFVQKNKNNNMILATKTLIHMKHQYRNITIQSENYQHRLQNKVKIEVMSMIKRRAKNMYALENRLLFTKFQQERMVFVQWREMSKNRQMNREQKLYLHQFTNKSKQLKLIFDAMKNYYLFLRINKKIVFKAKFKAFQHWRQIKSDKVKFQKYKNVLPQLENKMFYLVQQKQFKNENLNMAVKSKQLVLKYLISNRLKQLTPMCNEGVSLFDKQRFGLQFCLYALVLNKIKMQKIQKVCLLADTQINNIRVRQAYSQLIDVHSCRKKVVWRLFNKNKGVLQRVFAFWSMKSRDLTQYGVALDRTRSQVQKWRLLSAMKQQASLSIEVTDIIARKQRMRILRSTFYPMAEYMNHLFEANEQIEPNTLMRLQQSTFALLQLKFNSRQKLFALIGAFSRVSDLYLKQQIFAPWLKSTRILRIFKAKNNSLKQISFEVLKNKFVQLHENWSHVNSQTEEKTLKTLLTKFEQINGVKTIIEKREEVKEAKMLKNSFKTLKKNFKVEKIGHNIEKIVAKRITGKALQKMMQINENEFTAEQCFINRERKRKFALFKKWQKFVSFKLQNEQFYEIHVGKIAFTNMLNKFLKLQQQMINTEQKQNKRIVAKTIKSTKQQAQRVHKDISSQEQFVEQRNDKLKQKSFNAWMTILLAIQAEKTWIMNRNIIIKRQTMQLIIDKFNQLINSSSQISQIQQNKIVTKQLVKMRKQTYRNIISYQFANNQFVKKFYKALKSKSTNLLNPLDKYNQQKILSLTQKSYDSLISKKETLSYTQNKIQPSQIGCTRIVEKHQKLNEQLNQAAIVRQKYLIIRVTAQWHKQAKLIQIGRYLKISSYFLQWKQQHYQQKLIARENAMNRLGQAFLVKHKTRVLKQCYLQMKLNKRRVDQMLAVADSHYKTHLGLKLVQNYFVILKEKVPVKEYKWSTRRLSHKGIDF